MSVAEFDPVRGAEWLRAMMWVDRCDKAIKEYADLGISGTVHDLEHRQMREDYARLARELWP